jgi:Smg protein
MIDVFMFDILVYLYETYNRPKTCPDSIALARKLSAVGFDDDEIIEALDWLSGLADSITYLDKVDESGDVAMQTKACAGFRIYTQQESSFLGSASIGFLHYLENLGLLNTQQREIVIERAMALDMLPIGLDKLKVVVLMVLWSHGNEPDMVMFDDLLILGEENTLRLLH